ALRWRRDTSAYLERAASGCGVITSAFELEEQPYFAGFRSLATNGIDKPILNLFQRFGLMSGTARVPVKRLPVAGDGAVGDEQILKEGMRRGPDVNALASGGNRVVCVLAWNCHDDDLPAPEATVRLSIEGLPRSIQRALIRHFRIDDRHSSAFTAWKE